MPRRILIVDDIAVNRYILKNALCRDYDILEAENGEEALAIMHRSYKMLSAVLLDIVMPVMDGYEVLRRIQDNVVLSQIPVIVITGSEDEQSRVKALALGANDFVTKPYNPEIIKHCLRNNIALRETASIVNAIQKDKLTGIYNREFFFEKAGDLIKRKEPGHFILSCFDIDNFKLVNDQLGAAEGDRILKHIGAYLRELFADIQGVCGRISGDNFAALFPNEPEIANRIAENHKTRLLPKDTPAPLQFSVGRYVVNDRALPVSAIYDRAYIAKQSVKGRYDEHIAYFSDSMLEELTREQQIVSEMDRALAERQFEVWFQPQYNHSTGALIGSEALARWRHPAKGLICPGEFIPVFERNGFVYALDKFVWEEACRYLRKWIDEGRAPLPVSVNISRYDIFRPDLIDVITGLVDRYGIPVDLLRLEITESAFAESMKQIVQIVKALIDRGFTVEIDDFGSGYSSLNTLKSVPAQIVKLDMRFLEDDDDSERGGNILESIVRMTKWLNMSVIAEGVETVAQANFLKSIGCSYVQGYLYARPMPAEDYEKLCEGAGKEERLLALETVENLDNNAFWDPRSMDTLIFSSYVGAACIFEYCDGNIELLRANDKFVEILGSGVMTVEDTLKLDWLSCLTEESLARVRNALRYSIDTGDEVTAEYAFLNIPGCRERVYLRSTMRVIASAGTRYLVYCSSESITAQREAEQRATEVAERMRLVMDNVGQGITATVFKKDAVELLFSNDRYYEILGYTREQYAAEVKDPYLTIHPEDRRGMAEKVAEINRVDKSACVEYRALRRDGTAIWLRSTITTCEFVGVEGPVQLAMYRDISEEKQAKKTLQTLMDDTPGGFCRMQVFSDGRASRLVYCNEGFCKLVGMRREEVMRTFGETMLGGMHPDDFAAAEAAMNRLAADGGQISTRCRLRHGEKGYLWVQLNGRLVRTGTGETFLNSYYSDITEQVRGEEKQKDLLDNLPYGAALFHFDGKDLAAVHINKRYWELVGRAPGKYAGASILSAVHPEDRATITCELAAAVSEHRDAVCDLRILCEKGEHRLFHIVGRIVPAEDGADGYSVYAAYTPITDEAVSIREMLPVALDAMMASQTDFAFVKDKSLRYVCCSRAFAHLAGLKSEKEIAGKTDRELFEPALAEGYVADDRRLLKSGESLVDYTETMPSEDGSTRYVNTSKYLLHDSRGNVIGLYGVSRDITDAREKESQRQLLINSIPGGIATYEGTPDALEKMRITYFSDGFCRMFGYTREEYERRSAKNPLGLVFAEDMPTMMEQVRALVKEGKPMDCIYRAQTRDGGAKWINIKAVIGENNGDNMTVNAVLFDVTLRQEAMERLRISEETNRLAMEHTGHKICKYSIADKTLTLPETNPIFSLKKLVKNVPESPVKKGEISQETAAAYTAFYEGILHGEKTGTAMFQRISKKGWRWIEAHYTTLFSDTGEPVSAVVSYSDVTEQLEKEAVFKKWQQSFADKRPEDYTLFRCNITKDTSYDTVEGALLRANFKDGVYSFDERTKEYATQCICEEDQDRYIAFLRSDTLLAGYYRGKRFHTIDYREKLQDGDVRWLRLSIDLVEYPGSTDVEAYLMYESIDESKRAELMTIARAETDPLTGVLNRTAFISKVESLLQSSAPETRHALMMLDIDGFKLVNDTFGHAAGDEVLIGIANSLHSVLRKDDLLGRLGGDEFVIFLNDIPDDTVAANKAKRVCAMTRKSFSPEIQMSGSVGIVVCPRDGSDFETLYKKADDALYHVKDSGKNNYAFYYEDMDEAHRTLTNGAFGNSGTKTSEKKRRMLIVDDSAIDHALLANMFREEFIIEKAKDGNSALIRLRHYGSAVSVVLLDLVMPGMDGFAVLEKMKSSAEMRSIPVIVVSGAEDRETSLKAIQCGASDFVMKPVEPALLRLRVQSAISKAENERLRAMNSYLELQNDEIIRYKTALACTGVSVIEHDWLSGTFVYEPSVAKRIAGTYDDRKLWRILLSDMVADTLTVQQMQQLVHDVAEDRTKTVGSMLAKLNTPSGERRWFRINVCKLVNEYQLADKLIITLSELESAESPAVKAR